MAGTSDPATAHGLWLATAAVTVAALVMRGPFAMFWRADSSLLSRLPLEGKVLYRIALGRDVVTGLRAFLTLALGTTPLVATGALPAASGGRMLGVLAVLAVCASILGTVLATAAGTFVASASAQRAFSRAIGGASAPPLAWLSVLPGTGGAAVGLVALALLPWSARGTGATFLGPGGIWLAGLVVVTVLVTVSGGVLARRHLGRALRVVSALDRSELAHVDLVSARGAEAAWGRLAAGGDAGRAIYRKDVALARRRYPVYYLLVGLAIGVAWAAAAFAGPGRRELVVVSAAVAMAAYAVLLARRLGAPPVEYPRLIAILPPPRQTWQRAKGAYVAWRVVVPVVLALAPLVVLRALGR